MDNGKSKQVGSKQVASKRIVSKQVGSKRIVNRRVENKQSANEQIAKEIKVYGMVQGVGFRPLIYHVAKKWDIQGYVRNVGGYVEIMAYADEERLENFLKEIKGLSEEGYEINRIEINGIEINRAEINRIEINGTEIIGTEIEPAENFIILESEGSDEISMIPPDLPICPRCQEELGLKSDRRWNNAFISCAACGPRYTVIEAMPYDRPSTVMKDFDMCPACEEEYTSSANRRFHAQTISCNDCGPYLIYHGRDFGEQQGSLTKAFQGEALAEALHGEALEAAVQALKAGGILAVKGIGGYHLVCSPFMEETVQRLRSLKGREEKPFAVMFASLQAIEKYCVVSGEERRLLESKARPIVLLAMHRNDMAPSTNKRSIYCGAFLPYTPLQVLLTEECGPLIMTSANVSNQSIIREDEVILSLEAKELSGVLYHKRRIVRSVDDSVVKILDGKPQLLRRSRGYAPYPIFLGQGSDKAVIDCDTKHIESQKIWDAQKVGDAQKTGDTQKVGDVQELGNVQEIKDTQGTKDAQADVIFAAGGDLKAAFCLYHKNQAVVSQYLGDLEYVSVRQEYEQSYSDLTRLLNLKPALAVCDLHPNYLSSRFAKQLNLPVLEVQHHHAHIASVMAEHDLKGRVLGVAFDGTGYGTDGNIWGGEFLVCENSGYVRAAHLKYIPLLGGDGSVKDALKTATCFLISSGMEEYIQDEREDVIKAALKHGINHVLSSSMGRLFDAAASILGVGQFNKYEGECAVLLEQEAALAQREGILPAKLEFALSERDGVLEIDPAPALKALCQLRNRTDTASLALGFHEAVARITGRVCRELGDRYQTRQVALSGGVFQNTVLTEKALGILREDGFKVYVNQSVPPNDGGISLGQVYLGRRSIDPGVGKKPAN